MRAFRISYGSGTTAENKWYPITDGSHTWAGNIPDDTWGIDRACDQIGPPLNLGAYQARAHWVLSNQAARKMMLSYWCPFVDHNKETGSDVSALDVNLDGCCDFFNAEAYKRGEPAGESAWESGRIRFWDLDLLKLPPWRTSNCWI